MPRIVAAISPSLSFFQRFVRSTRGDERRRRRRRRRKSRLFGDGRKHGDAALNLVGVGKGKEQEHFYPAVKGFVQAWDELLAHAPNLKMERKNAAAIQEQNEVP
jgi:hypothetical protein